MGPVGESRKPREPIFKAAVNCRSPKGDALIKKLASGLFLLWASASSVSAATVVGDSDIFLFDTRTALGNASGSEVFAFDTRGAMGAQESSLSGLFAFDTRSGRVLTLAIGGPSECAPGATLPLECWSYSDDGTFAEVGALCEWWIEGDAPAGTVVGAGQFTAGTPSVPTTVKVRAGYRRPTGYVVAPPYEITIAKSLTARLDSPMVTSAGPGAWDLNALAEVAGAYGPIAWQWQLDGVTLAGANGFRLLNWRVTGQEGTRILKITATDGQGRRASAAMRVVFNKPTVVNEPVQRILASDPTNGKIMDSTGATFEFQSDRKSTGLIVLTHGLNGSGSDEWLKQLSNAIFARLYLEPKDIPNICILDWQDWADPVQIEQPTLSGPWWLDFMELGRFGLTLPGQVLTSSLLGDVWLIRHNAIAQGVVLCAWVQKEITAGNIDPNAPIHLIGHSAGGFVMGECARQLRIAGIAVTQVTMLDTPLQGVSDKVFFTDRPGITRMERYFSYRGLGGLASPTVLNMTQPPNGYMYEVPDSPFWLAAAHSYVHDWYRNTAWYNSMQNGFYYSPFMENGFHGMSVDAVMSLAGDATPLDATDFDPAPFDYFGDVSLTAGVYRVVEQDNAGIYQTVALPVGAQLLRFRYRFATPGDGDFLVVSWGDDNLPLYTGPDVSGMQTGAVDVVVSLAAWAGQTNTLTLKLVSRGEANAVLEIDSLRIEVSTDPDEDGLTTEQELPLGTDPLYWDTDGDGLSDGEEASTYGTNPMQVDTDGDGVTDRLELLAGTLPTDSESCFKVVRAESAEGSLLKIVWNGRADRTYRINRRQDLTQLGYDTVATGITGVEPQTEFTVPAVEPAASPMFYWVEME